MNDHAHRLLSQVVLATGNKGKVGEFAELLTPLNITVSPQSEYGIGSQFPEAEETGLTFVENAIIKARYASGISGLPALSDDSGIEIDALDGEPGVYSARYAGEHGDAKSNNALVMQKLQGVPTEQRTARFHCVLCYIRHPNDPAPIIAHGIWEGHIIDQEIGVNGFGYDPLFWVPGYDCTAAQLEPTVKNQLSHRGQALKQLIDALASMVR